MKETPLIKQYNSFKNKYKDKIVLFRMGDFFETFGEDAKIAAKTLNITLTQRNRHDDPTPLAGFPHHALEQYLPKLIEAGLSAVIVDQVEDPKQSKGIVKRAVTKIVTPGTIDSEKANQKNNNVLAISKQKQDIGLVICDLYEGDVKVTSVQTEKEITDIITSFEVVEVILSSSEKFPEGFINTLNVPIQLADFDTSREDEITKIIKEQFKVNSMHSLAIEKNPEIIAALGLLTHFFKDTQKIKPRHLNNVKWLPPENYLKLDHSTIRNLELVDSTSGYSLFSVLDECRTNMGKRILRSWILHPLAKAADIKSRLETVQFFHSRTALLESIRELLSDISDIERITGRIGLERANARDYKALSLSIEQSHSIFEMIEKEISNKKADPPDFIKNLSEKKPAKALTPLVQLIEKSIKDEPSSSLTEGNIIKEGVDEKLDQLREIAGNSKKWLKDFEKSEREKTDIPSLKIKSNKVFGYFIEVTNTHKDKVPSDYIRKQTMVNCERYITEELKEKEDIIFNSQDKIAALEYEIFGQFRRESYEYIGQLQYLANLVATIDVLSNFAWTAIHNNYIKPDILPEKSGVISIKDGRHPVVESAITKKMAGGDTESFIPNDIQLDNGRNNLIIITGPNMSGKSTYIRQVAVLVLMTHIGSFIPATKAEISPVDRIFTRIGASDDLSGGRSTFMVEMDEVANITNNATSRSLVVLDEVGRGTSTYDGISIAWAIAEHLLDKIGARTIFATHYHELMKLEKSHPHKVRNYNVAVAKDPDRDEVVFLRKIEKGGTNKSYGIYVAKMAGLQDEIIKNANRILSKLTSSKDRNKPLGKAKDEVKSISLFNGSADK